MNNSWNSFERLLHRCDHPPQFCGIVIAITAVAAVGMTAYGMATAPGAPKTQSAPPPSSSVQYGDDGEVISTQSYDEKTNTWITKGRNSEPTKVDDPGPEPTQPTDGFSRTVYQAAHGVTYEQDLADWKEKKKAYDEYKPAHDKWAADKAKSEEDKKKLSDLRTKMLDNLNTTPEDRVKAYAEYQQKFADAAHRDIDPRFAKIERTADEQANATGMFGSRAYVDTKSELTNDKLRTDQDIASQAVLAGEQLASNDRSYYANMLNQIDNGARADTLAASQIAKNSSDVSNQQYAGLLANNQMQNNNIMSKWQTQQAQSASYVNAGSNLAGGLLYLYGNKSGGGKSASTYNASKPSGEFT